MSIEISIAPPNSIIFISDPTQRVEIPSDVGSNLVAATPSCVSIGTLAEMDGVTKIQLGRDAPDIEAGLVFDGDLQTPGYKVAVSDIHAVSILTMDVPSATTRLKVWANDSMEPDLIVVMAR